MMHEEMITKLAELFMETGHAHHQAFIETDGADPDWPLWYADYLMAEDRLNSLLGVEFVKSELVYVLMHLSFVQPLEAPGAKWPRYYGKELVRRYL